MPGNEFGCDTSTLTFGNLWFGLENGVLPFNAVNNNAFNAGGGSPGTTLNKSIGNSNYQGLQVNVEKRFGHGLQFQGAYTYSHTISDVNDPLNPAAGNERSHATHLTCGRNVGIPILIFGIEPP